MNTNQRQKILDAIESYKKLDKETGFVKKHGSFDNADRMYVGEFNISELFAITDRVVNQLESFLNGGCWMVLPCENVTLSLYGRISLWSSIMSIRDNLNRGMYEQVVHHVKALVYYAMNYGIWNRDNSTKAGELELSLMMLEEKAKLSLAEAEANEEKLNKLIETLDSKLTEMGNMINQKNLEFEKLKAHQLESDIILKNIVQVRDATFASEAEINKRRGELAHVLEEANSMLRIVNKQINQSGDSVSKGQDSLKQLFAESRAQSEQIKTEFEKVSSCYEEARKLTDFIKDAALGDGFDKRRKSVHSAVWLWGVLSVICAMGVCWWIYYVFTDSNSGIVVSATAEKAWISIVLTMLFNIGRVSPMIVLFCFILAQYRKERHILEEYAFRSTVAITLTSYLNQLKEAQEEDERMLLKETIKQLYTKPVIMGDNRFSVSLKSKDVVEAVKGVSEAIRSFNAASRKQ